MHSPFHISAALTGVSLALAGQIASTPVALSAPAPMFSPNNLVVSRSVYQGTASTVTVGQLLPPNCPSTAKCGGGPNNKGVLATDNGLFPAIGSTNSVWNNNKVDGSFGVTSPIYVDQMTPSGRILNTLPIDPTKIVTSFSSKSELALNLATDGSAVTFMGYITHVNTLDASNSNTPGVVDPTNPVGENIYRAVAQLDASGALKITDTNAYSGNNGRAAILSRGLYYAVGNDNNGGGTPADVVTSTGAELIVPGAAPGTPQMIGTFSITQYGYPADKLGKDNNFRGLTIFDNTLYVTKGSGGNGINTVYQVGNARSLPNASDAATAPITILPGLPTTLAKNADAQNPFGIFFANANTLYVADEGDGVVADAATSPNAGLQKWVRNSAGTWQRVYVLQAGLSLGQPYAVTGNPTSLNPSPDGLRNLTGRVNADGSVDLWAVTSTVSANGDQGADPNQLVFISDKLHNTDATVAAKEHFAVLRTAAYGEVLRGVSFAPGTIASAPRDGRACDGVFKGDFDGNLRVDEGQHCAFVGGSIAGNVQVGGGSLSLANTSVGGNVRISDRGTFSIGPAVTIDGNLKVDDSSSAGGPNQICDSRIRGNLQLHGSRGAVDIGSTSPTCGGNEIAGNLDVRNNSGAVTIEGNRVSGNLQCRGNAEIVGGGNSAELKAGQCAAL